MAASCLEPYTLPPTVDKRLLVVDGFINSLSGLAKVKLSRSQPLDAIFPYPAERFASVFVESENNQRFQLPETQSGIYETVRSDLQVGLSYRLHITTAAGDQFVSDLVELKQAPVLKDVFWVRDGDGITIRVDAEDETGATRYYQWVYTETWEYDSDSNANFILKGGGVVVMTPAERINICYSTDASSKVLISTTSDQTHDVVNDFALVHIPRGSRKLSRTYSILVEQRALDDQAYNYWLQLQRSTENLGGLFDPPPTEVTGNVRPTKSGGPVALGYFNGGGVEQKRIYIRFNELPQEFQYVKRLPCMVDTVSVLGYPQGSPFMSAMPPTRAFVQEPNHPRDICMDCRLHGGTTKKPDFWAF